MDMCFYWIQYIILQRHFNVFWKPVLTKLGDYHSKHHQRLTTFKSVVLTYMDHIVHIPYFKDVLNPQTVKLPV